MFKRPRDEEVVATIVKVVLREGSVDSQSRLHALVEKALKARDADYRVSAERVRVLALRSRLVSVRIHASLKGLTPELEKCPVCGAKLKRTASRTLTGGTAPIGYRCTSCPYWTGREHRVPHRYAFQALLEKPRGGQTTFATGAKGE